MFVIFAAAAGIGHPASRWPAASPERQHYTIASSIQIHLRIASAFIESNATNLRRHHLITFVDNNDIKTRKFQFKMNKRRTKEINIIYMKRTEQK